MVYEHTQRSPFWLLVTIPVVAIAVVVVIATSGNTIALLAGIAGSAAFIALGWVFSSLTVTLDSASARAAFGRGWPRKRVDLSEVVSAERVRNRWWYGFGIRLILKGQLWNVWGLDAVEFRLASGRVVRFGTDDPDGLMAALVGRIPTV